MWSDHLSGGNPDAIARDRVYFAYLARATTELLADLQKLEGQKHEASTLVADEKRLARVVEELRRALDRQEKERVRAARGDVAKRGATKDGADARKEERVDSSASTGEDSDARARKDATNGDFARLMGSLRLPVRGTLTARYGSQRGDGAGRERVCSSARNRAQKRMPSPRAGWYFPTGCAASAIYLSIYGNNESLLKRAGDTAKRRGAGDRRQQRRQSGDGFIL